MQNLSTVETVGPQESLLKKSRRSRISKSEIVALAFCLLFSVLLIVNVHTANEGGWYWYARLLLQGHRLYSGMHLALQPLFVEETALFLAIFGKSWLASKIAAVFHAALFCFGLHLLLRRTQALTGVEKAVLLTCGFFTSIAFVGYRFDDYHVLSDCLQVFSILLLLKITEAATTRRATQYAALVGVLAGFSITTRINDGAALFLAVLIGVFCLRAELRLLFTAITGASTILTIIIVVCITGDSLHAWLSSSVFRAAATKGGTANVLRHPFELPYSSFETLKVWQDLQFTLYLLISAALVGLFIAPLLSRRGKRRLWPATLAAAVIVLPLHRYWYRGNFQDQKLIIDLAAVGVFVIFALGVSALPAFLWRLWRDKRTTHDPMREILFLVPLGQLAAGAMSSAGTHIGVYGPLAITIVLVPVVFRDGFSTRIALRGFTIAIAAVLAAHVAVFRWNVPYLWHTYRAERILVDRQWYRHPDYGPMLIDVNLLHMIQPICDQIGHEPDSELLSLPYPYPNYFCSIPPWHQYVQTFFDTSNSGTIFHLMDELRTSPPKWIVYQRQLQVLSMHEMTYNHGQPLPHRYLDQLIERKLASGEWTATDRSTFGTRPGLNNEWILIRTGK